jgi:hypothetical protein
MMAIITGRKAATIEAHIRVQPTILRKEATMIAVVVLTATQHIRGIGRIAIVSHARGRGADILRRQIADI